jgi:hypothetical protein
MPLTILSVARQLTLQEFTGPRKAFPGNAEEGSLTGHKKSEYVLSIAEGR